jgi:hypothetical protein
MFTSRLFGRVPSRRRPAAARRAGASCQLRLEHLEERCLLSADPVLEWNKIALDALQFDSTQGANALQNAPTLSSRALAIESAAVYDTVNSIDQTHQPYLIQVDAPKDASMTAAVAQAAHDTLVSLLPDYKPTLDARLNADLASVSDPQARKDGVQVGANVAAAVLNARSNDGSNAPMSYTPGNQPGQWRPDPLHLDQQALSPQWGNVTPFALPSAEKFGPKAPPDITSQAYAKAYQEVKSLGGDGINTPTQRTAEQTQIGIFWGYDGSPGLGTPPVLYNQIAETLAVQQGNTPVQNARYFALINIAMADAGIAAWDTKYDDNFWRPVAAIRENDPGTGPTGKGSGNPYLVGQGDPNWTPLGAPRDNGSGTNFTPPFPAYVSGHATFGGALFQMMADFYGTDNIPFTIGSDEFNGVTTDQSGNVRPVVFRSFDSFSQAAEENGQSRIYLGIHWSFDKVQGIKLGDKVANFVFDNFLQPTGEDGGGDSPDSIVSGGPSKPGQGTGTALNPTPKPATLQFPQQPATTAAGQTISPAVKVGALDPSGHPFTAGTEAVTLTLGNNPGGGTLSGTLTVQPVNGVATFSDLSIDKAGTGSTLLGSTGNLPLLGSTGDLKKVTSAAFNIT